MPLSRLQGNRPLSWNRSATSLRALGVADEGKAYGVIGRARWPASSPALRWEWSWGELKPLAPGLLCQSRPRRSVRAGPATCRCAVSWTRRREPLHRVRAEHAPAARRVLDRDRRVDLDRYDVLRFRWKMADDPPRRPSPSRAIPRPMASWRNYYLLKRPNPPGQWQDVWLDLRQDDDGVVLERHRCPQARSGSASRWRFPIWGSFPSALRYAFAWPISASCAIP